MTLDSGVAASMVSPNRQSSVEYGNAAIVRSVLAGALSASWLPALAEPAAIRTCGHDVMENCAALSDANGGPIQGIATDACTSFNATMTQFCEMLGDHEPDSPEMLAATAKVIAAKRHLLKQLKKPNGERS